MGAFLSEIIAEPKLVDRELQALGISREDVREIAIAAASARAGSLEVDPQGTPGHFSYTFGVRATRLRLLPAGWRMARFSNVESTVNHKLGVQLVFQNVVSACGASDPEPISPKGAGSRRLVNDGQGELFQRESSSPEPLVGKVPVVWLICVSSDSESVRAEVSCPKVFEGNYFQGFSRRLFVIDEKVGPTPSRRHTDIGVVDLDDDLDVHVSRKE